MLKHVKLVSKLACLELAWLSYTPKLLLYSCIFPGNPVEGWGTYLEAQGFAKYGQETMISGSTGLEMPCDIFIGLVYYQRLRHMVSDKFQVSAEERVDLSDLHTTKAINGTSIQRVMFFKALLPRSFPQTPGQPSP